VRAAKGFVEDVGVQSASKSVGLVELASRLEKNAERDCHRLMANRLELSLPIPQSTLKVEDSQGRDLHLPVLRLRDWAQYLVDGNHAHILTGLTTPDWKRESDILTAFGPTMKYKNQHTLCLKWPAVESWSFANAFPWLLMEMRVGEGNVLVSWC
jgi:hypothetical protein